MSAVEGIKSSITPVDHFLLCLCVDVCGIFRLQSTGGFSCHIRPVPGRHRSISWWHNSPPPPLASTVVSRWNTETDSDTPTGLPCASHTQSQIQTRFNFHISFFCSFFRLFCHARIKNISDVLLMVFRIHGKNPQKRKMKKKSGATGAKQSEWERKTSRKN